MPRVLDEKVPKSRIPHSVRNRRPTREHAVSGGIRLKALSRVSDYRLLSCQFPSTVLSLAVVAGAGAA